jgi:pimeloyl-ACP methyl ester carboxylesterase
MKDSLIDVGGGRQLAYTDIGRPDGVCLFFFHGAPMSRLHLVDLEDDFAARGLRVVSPDRPGYGRSSPQPGRSMVDWPNDVEAVADALGIERFIVAGHSSGGPYAAACCALLPRRVLAGAIVAGVTDMGWPGAWNGYVESEAELMREPDERAALAWCIERYGADGSGFQADPFPLPEPDSARLADPAFDRALTSTVVEAFRQGVIGYAQDCYVQGRAWPFDPNRIAAPVLVVHGELDTLMPVAHSRHTAGLMPGSSVRTLPGHGHLTIVYELPSLAASLASSLG